MNAYFSEKKGQSNNKSLKASSKINRAHPNEYISVLRKSRTSFDHQVSVGFRKLFIRG